MLVRAAYLCSAEPSIVSAAYLVVEATCFHGLYLVHCRGLRHTFHRLVYRKVNLSVHIRAEHPLYFTIDLHFVQHLRLNVVASMSTVVNPVKPRLVVHQAPWDPHLHTYTCTLSKVGDCA